MFPTVYEDVGIGFILYRLKPINYVVMVWEIVTTDTFDKWFDDLNVNDRTNVLAGLFLLEEKGPHLTRPYADAVNNSEYPNMKELRVQSKGSPIRVFFAFDPGRKGVLLCARNKVGNEKRFYKQMIPIADAEYAAHLESLRN